MEFQLLYDFLKSGLTKKAFATECKISFSSLDSKLTKQLQQLERTKIINLNDYVANKYSILIIEVRSKRDMWMRAIEAYNEAVLALQDMDLTPLDFIAQIIYLREFNENTSASNVCWLEVNRETRANYRNKAETLFSEWKLKQSESLRISQ